MTNIIAELKAQFLNNVVEVTEKEPDKAFKELDQLFGYVECEIAPNDTTIAQLEAVVKAKGYALSVWLPNTVGTMDYREDRVNAHVKKANDGKYRITGLNIG